MVHIFLGSKLVITGRDIRKYRDVWRATTDKNDFIQWLWRLPAL
jgi:hypothetical protein